MSYEQLATQVQQACKEFCAALTQDEVSQFVRYVDVIELTPQEVLANVGDVGDSFYMVIAGSIQLFQIEGEKEFEVGELAAGSLVGEMSFFDQKPRTVRLTSANNGARLLEINRQMYNRLRIEEPYISTNLLEFVIRSLDELVRQLSEQNAILHKRTSEITA
ncbi:MAG: Crp/Fnr family transcriptional regulator [Thiolinea sp.]